MSRSYPVNPGAPRSGSSSFSTSQYAPSGFHASASGQSEAAHGLAISHRYRVEAQVQLIGQVERDALRALGFHDHLVLAEDGVLEVTQDLVGLVGVVVPADHDV